MAQTLPKGPDGVAEKTVEPKVERFASANFVKRSAIGFNNTLAEVEVAWTPKLVDYWKEIEDFFEAHKGVDYFLWQMPGDSAAKRWICKNWGRSHPNGLSDTVVTLTATFEEVLE